VGGHVDGPPRNRLSEVEAVVEIETAKAVLVDLTSAMIVMSAVTISPAVTTTSPRTVLKLINRNVTSAGPGGTSSKR
jgi:hypothetical protein